MRSGVYDEHLTVTMNNLLLKYDYDILIEFLYNEDNDAFHDAVTTILNQEG